VFLLISTIKQTLGPSGARIPGWNCHLLIILFWALKALNQQKVAEEEGLCRCGRSVEAAEGKVTLSQVSQRFVGV